MADQADPPPTLKTRYTSDRERSVLNLASIVLKVVEGPDAGLQISVTGRSVTIGKGPACDLRLTDPSVSRVHAAIAHGSHGFTIEDLGSTNGTLVDGVAIQKAHLRAGSLVWFGDTTVQFAPQTSRLVSTPPAIDHLEGLVGASVAM